MSELYIDILALILTLCFVMWAVRKSVKIKFLQEELPIRIGDTVRYEPNMGDNESYECEVIEVVRNAFIVTLNDGRVVFAKEDELKFN